MINFPRIHNMKKIITAGGLLESSPSSPSSSPLLSVSSLSSHKKSDSCSSSLSSSSKKKKKKPPKNEIKTDATLIHQQQQQQQRSNNDPIDKSNKEESMTSRRRKMTTTTRKRTVRFEKTAKVKRIRPRHQYSAKELEEMWYTESDYAEIKRHVVETVKLMMKKKKNSKKEQKQYHHQNQGSRNSSANCDFDEFIENDDHTIRGLECRTKKAAMQRKETKMFARNRVLEEQENQIDQYTKVISHNMIRKVYLDASIVSSRKAQAYGRMDEGAVKNNDDKNNY